MKIPDNGELESTIIGTILMIGSAGFLFLETIPWTAAAAGVGIGLYLLVPNRVQKIVDLINKLRRGNGA